MTRPSIVARSLAAILLLSLPILAFADAPIWPVQINSSSGVGSLVLVSMTNCSASTVSAQVNVQAVVGDCPIWSRGTLFLAAGQTGVAMVSFPGPVQRVLSVAVQ